MARKTSGMEYVILGTGPAGVTAAEILSQKDGNAHICLVGGENEHPYARMAIPYYLKGNIGEPGLWIKKNRDFFKDRNLELLNHSKAQGIDADRKEVLLADGTLLKFDKLLIATGSIPNKLDIPGIDSPDVHHCWTLEDARQIQKKAAQRTKVTLIGAGFIGCIILDALMQRGVELTVIESEDRMVPRMLNQTAGNLLCKWCAIKGLTVQTSARVNKIEPTQDDSQGKYNIYLDHMNTGATSELYSDLVIVTAGVKPNVGFLTGSGLQIQEGIVVDKYLQTKLDDIYAAGDVAQGVDYFGASSVHAIQSSAVEQGRLAAMNMAGIKTPYQGSLAMNVLDTLGLISFTYGIGENKGAEPSEFLQSDAFRYLRLEFRDDMLIGATALGLREHIGVLRGLIQSGIKLGAWKSRLLNDPNRVVEAYIAKMQL